MSSERLDKTEFDERQVLIRGQVFWHGLLVAVGLLLVNAMLQASSITWASGFAQNIFIILATAAVVATEAIMRGAFFGRRQNHWVLIWMFGAVGLAMVSLHTRAVFQTIGIPRADHVVFVVAGVLFCCIAIFGVAKEMVERRDRDCEDFVGRTSQTS